MPTFFDPDDWGSGWKGGGGGVPPGGGGPGGGVPGLGSFGFGGGAGGAFSGVPALGQFGMQRRLFPQMGGGVRAQGLNRSAQRASIIPNPPPSVPGLTPPATPPGQPTAMEALYRDMFTPRGLNARQGLATLLSEWIGGRLKPPGEEGILGLLRQQGQLSGMDRERSALLGTQIEGSGDPSLGAYAKMLARSGAAGDTQRQMLGSMTQGREEQERIMNQLLMAFLGAEGIQGGQGDRRNFQGGGSGLAGLFGGLGGAAIGSLFGPGGAGIGAGIGGRLGG